jgi:hypothetical protein
MISTGQDLYMKAAAHFWITEDDANGPAMAAALHGKWLMIPGPETRSSTYAPFCSLKARLSDLSSDDGEGTVSKGRPATLDGRSVDPLVHTTPDATTTIHVATEGTPYIVKAVKRNGIAPSTTIFTDFGRTVHVTAPSADLTVGIDTVIGDDGTSS